VVGTFEEVWEGAGNWELASPGDWQRPAHATLMRRLETDLAQATGLALADFDVLAQLANAGGELRMTELADRAFISRSGMTRRVAHLVEDGLVRRANAEADALATKALRGR
jgi:DNA-binding MarR family transcriptional regulator